jgi:hypothetical protein
LPNPEGKLLPGLYVDVTITVEHRDVWALPASAVTAVLSLLVVATLAGMKSLDAIV